MNKTGLKYIIIIPLTLLVNFNALSQQLWDDDKLIEEIKTGIFNTYSLNFQKAEDFRDTLRSIYPNHPASLMYEALIIYWKSFPLQAETKKSIEYETLLLKSIEESEIHLKKWPNHQLTNFWAMMPRLMLLQYYADNDLGMKSVPHISKLYKSVIKGFEYSQTTPEFFFTTGLYNYYREAYPEANPYYKPILFFFPEGNKEKGLKELYECWQKSDFVGSEALSFLSYIYINFETNYSKGIEYSFELFEKHPKNPLFSQYYLQLLLLNKQYSEAEIITKQLKQNKNISNYFKITTNLYDAIIKEHLYLDLGKAEKMYKHTIRSIKSYGNYGNKYLAYAYFGLHRIYKAKGLYDAAKACRKNALKYAQYPHINFD